MIGEVIAHFSFTTSFTTSFTISLPLLHGGQVMTAHVLCVYVCVCVCVYACMSRVHLSCV